MAIAVWAGDSGNVIELDRLAGPRTGRVEPPRHLFPDSPQAVTLDLDQPAHQARLYTACLLRGSPYDVYRYVNLADLAVLLPTLDLPADVADAWAGALRQAGLAAPNRPVIARHSRHALSPGRDRPRAQPVGP